MTFKAFILLFACLVIHQSYGCLNEVVRKDFDSMDMDKNGFLTQNEVFEACSSDDLSDEECERGWKSLDLNGDGQVICQESFVGALALLKGMERGNLGEIFRMIFADKPENCDEVPQEEVKTFVMTDNYFVNDEIVEHFQKFLDTNQDGIIACYEFLDRFYLSMQFEGMNMNNFDQDNFIEEGQLIQDSNNFV